MPEVLDNPDIKPASASDFGGVTLPTPSPKPVDNAPTDTPMPTPVPEAVEDDASLDAFNVAKGLAVAKKPDVDKTKVEAPVVKDKDNVNDNVVAPDLVSPAALKQQTVDFAQEFPDEAKFLRNMSNESRAFVIARLRDLKNAKTERETLSNQVKTLSEAPNNKIPMNWMEHEEAYTLHPEYKQAVGRLQQVDNAASFWREQYKKIELGEDWTNVSVGADGKPTQTLMQPGAEAKLYVMERMQELARIRQESELTAHNIQSTFGLGRKALTDYIDAQNNIFFPDYKGQEWEKGNKYYQGIIKPLAEKGLANNVLAPLTGRLYAFLMETVEENNQMRGLLKQQGVDITGVKTMNPTVKANQQKAGPTAATFSSGGSGPAKGEDILSMDAFNKRKMEY